MIQPHEWTNGGSEVLIVRFCAKDGTSKNNFRYPLEVGATVECPDWDAKAECGKGLHGWPWALSLGDGKECEWSALWQVYGVVPSEVVSLGGKVKFRVGTLRYSGDWQGATNFVLSGQIKLIQENASGAASATGWSGAASATGWSGAASATGVRGAASATGWRGAASATGVRGAASATGVRGAASATGERGAASATGESGAASATGESGAASATGWRGAASATGVRGAASATGESGAAVSCGEYSTVEAGKDGIAASTASVVTWIARKGSVFIQSIEGWYVCCSALEIGAIDGERITFENGVIVKREKP